MTTKNILTATENATNPATEVTMNFQNLALLLAISFGAIIFLAQLLARTLNRQPVRKPILIETRRIIRRK